MSNRETRISELEDKLDKATMYGAESVIDSCIEKITQFNAMTDEEYNAYVKLTKSYGANSVKPIITK